MLQYFNLFLAYSSFKVFVLSVFINILALGSSVFVIQVFNRYVVFGVEATLYTLFIGVLICIIFEFIFRILRNNILQINLFKKTHLINETIVERILNTDLTSLYQIKKIDQKKLSSCLEAIQNIYTCGNISIIIDLPFSLFFLFIIYIVSPLIFYTVIAVTTISIIMFILNFRSSKIYNRQNKQKNSENLSSIDEIIKNFELYKINNLYGKVKENFFGDDKFYQNIRMKLILKKSESQVLNVSLISFSSVLVICVGATEVVKGDLEIGALIGANILSMRMLTSFSRFLFILEPISQAANYFNLVRKINNLPSEKISGSGLSNYNGFLAFDDVDYYDSFKNEYIIRKLNFSFFGGNLVIIAGDSASGKTFLMKMILGLFEPTAGKILADKMDLRQISMVWWRSRVSYLPQNVSLINDTLLNNLRLYDENFSIEKLNSLIKTVGLREYVNKLPEGFDTKLTDEENVPFGIKKRIGIVRALSRDTPIYLFDDPFNGLNKNDIDKFYDHVLNLQKNGKLIFIVTNHSINLLDDQYLIKM